MANNMKIRAQLKDGSVEIKVLMSHPMETGRRKNDRGETEPAHFIQLVSATLNGKTVLEAQWGTGISKNPYLTFRLKAAKVGDIVKISWVDNKGATESIETAIVAG
ncbi:MAG TPA: thiosulfate oxidation carrier complex protein SoxZ [Novimethylophilus sp.]|jgi:sulfur-oxidizing protein SoxZ|uniref:thiosulfate oxidation carrier complex protein SoxZ n=1 Tax=Novimethylophilus sp. TaxID=2137426 RepID=UPI002F407B5E